jgi:hypothetical protein
MVMMAMLMGTNALTADDTDSWCQYAAQTCNSQCFSAWYGCRSMGNNPDLCQVQYDWCMDDCMGDYWCGFRQV